MQIDSGHSPQPNGSSQAEAGAIQSSGYIRSTVRFWEPLRAIYNAVLAMIVVAWIVSSWPHFRPAMSLGNLGRLLILAAIANVLYSVAYVVDLVSQQFSPPQALRAIRWTTWAVGMAFAILLTNYWIADEIYPYVQ